MKKNVKYCLIILFIGVFTQHGFGQDIAKTSNIEGIVGVVPESFKGYRFYLDMDKISKGIYPDYMKKKSSSDKQISPSTMVIDTTDQHLLRLQLEKSQRELALLTSNKIVPSNPTKASFKKTNKRGLVKKRKRKCRC